MLFCELARVQSWKNCFSLSLSVKGECVPVLTTVSPANDRMDFIKQQIRFSIWITCPRHKTSVYTSGFKSLQSDKTLPLPTACHRTHRTRSVTRKRRFNPDYWGWDFKLKRAFLRAVFWVTRCVRYARRWAVESWVLREGASPMPVCWRRHVAAGFAVFLQWNSTDDV